MSFRNASVLLGAVFVVLLVGVATDASAQSRRGGTTRQQARYGAQHKFELVPYGGYRWTVSIPVTVGFIPGDFDIADSGFWGVALDINTPQPDTQVRLAYDRQDSKAQFRSFQGTEENDASVEYLQIGALRGLRNGNVLPYGLFTLGATRYADSDGDSWKFSIVLGLGAKLYVSERIGIMVQGRMPYTFLSGGVGIGIGGGGPSVGAVGYGIAQFDVGGGIMILL